jgi:hypothetical protein
VTNELSGGLRVLDFKLLWGQGLTFRDFAAAAGERYKGLWEGVYRTSRVPEWAIKPASEERHFLVIAEDWCGDASNAVPAIARWVEAMPGFSLRIIRRDEHPAVMDRYLTNGTRSIPIVIVLDRGFRELGHWGPRPSELQAWVLAHKDTMPKDERYKEVRRWYAKDHGESTIREVLGVMQAERAA